MKKISCIPTAVILLIVALAGCSTAYKATPVSFRAPESYPNNQRVFNTVVGSEPFFNPDIARDKFGFDIIGAGILPVQVAFDNQGENPLHIVDGQTFLIGVGGSMWPILDSKFVQERTQKYTQTKDIFEKGSYGGFLGAAAGGLVGAAIGILSNKSVLASAGKGAAAGGVLGALGGGVDGAVHAEGIERIQDDVAQKSMLHRAIPPGTISFGMLFFPAEATQAFALRLQIEDTKAKSKKTVTLNF
ncbi:MAG: glycine zipper family protein [Magnetococcales bacterium]|nr:glycine zipper family protein [Magnetococcales bacterium]